MRTWLRRQRKTQGRSGRSGRRRKTHEPIGFWAWIGQAMSQLQEAMRGGSGPWQGPGA